MADSLAGIGAVDAGEYAGLGIGRDLKVSHAVDAAGAVGRVVDTGLARFIARHALPVARRFISNSTGGADLVAVAIVHEVAVGAVVADQVLGAALAAYRATLTNRTDRGETVVTLDLASSSLEEERSDAAVALSSR